MAGISGDLSWNWDLGISTGQMRTWWLGSFNTAQTSNNWNGRAVTTSLMTPPPVLDVSILDGSETYRALLDFDSSSDSAALYATNAAVECCTCSRESEQARISISVR